MESRKKKSITVLGLVSLLLVIIGVTYAAFSYSKVGTNENTISTSTISMSYTEGDNKITIDNALPTEDEVGKTLTEEGQVFDFTVSFNIVGKSAIAYEVVGEKEVTSTLLDNEVRIYLEKSIDGTNYSSIYEPTGYLPLEEDTDIGAKKGEMLLDTGSVDETLTYYYRLRMWVAKDYVLTGESKFFTLRINVYGKDSNLFTAKDLLIDMENITMKQEEKVKPNVVVLPDYTTDKTLTWTSSNENIVKVTESGEIEAIGIGEAEVTVSTNNGITKTIHVTVTTNRYTIEIENEKGEIEEIEVKYNENYNLPTLEKEGYEFVGWFTEPDGGGNQITNDMPTDDTIKKLYPHFIPKEYEISFDKQDGTESDKIKVTYDSVYENLPIPEREGYTFGGWYLDTDYTEEIRNGDTVKITDNTNLYAKWIPNKYTVTLDGNGGSVTPTSIEVTYNYIYSGLPTPTRTGYTFAGWYTEREGGSIVNTTDTVSILSNITLYAHWTANNYTITFNANGGSVGQASKPITYGQSYGTLPTPSKTGYSFQGWYTALSGGTEITESTLVNNEGITVYARWRANTYSVSFNANGGGAVGTVLTVTYDSTYGTLPTPSRTGYSFAGWFTAASGGSQVTNSTKVSITSNQTLYAHWNINSYGVTINTSNANKSTGSLNINYGGNGTVTITPTSGYYLSGASCTNGYTTNATTGTSKTGAQTVTIYNNSKTTGSTCTFTGTKAINQNISSPPACVTSGTCSAGTSINYKVNGSTTQSFYVLKDNGSTLTLISSSVVATSVAWDSSGKNSYGPRTATQKLESATSSWTNVPANTYNESTGTATRARLITKAEAESVGCTTSTHSCPTWLTDSSYWHWTSTPYSSHAGIAWIVRPSSDRYLHSTSYISSSNSVDGVRAVITISKK